MFLLNASDVWSLLESQRGPQTLPLETAIPLTVINVLIFISGLLGNIAVCVVIIKHRTLHTATNYYLFNLAVSDLTLLIFGLPNDVLVYWHQYPWPFGEEFCKLRSLLSEMASYVSVLTIVAFSTERYLAICHPLYSYTMSGLRRALKIILFVWFVSFLSALPFSIYTRVYEIEYPPDSGNYLKESAFCAMLFQPVPLSEISTIFFFILPMLIIAVEYSCMAVEISKRTKHNLGDVNANRSSRRSKSHKIIIRMLAVVVAAFFICWAPFHAQRLIYEHAKNSPHYETLNEYFFYVTGILYYLSSTLNPLLYNIMSRKYRLAFRAVICGSSKGGSLQRTSTFREKSPMSSENEETTKSRLLQNRLSQQKKEPVTDQLMSDDRITISSKKNGCSLIYEINYNIRDFADLKPNSETCI